MIKFLNFTSSNFFFFRTAICRMKACDKQTVIYHHKVHLQFGSSYHEAHSFWYSKSAKAIPLGCNMFYCRSVSCMGKSLLISANQKLRQLIMRLLFRFIHASRLTSAVLVKRTQNLHFGQDEPPAMHWSYLEVPSIYLFFSQWEFLFDSPCVTTVACQSKSDQWITTITLFQWLLKATPLVLLSNLKRLPQSWRLRRASIWHSWDRYTSMG